MEVITPSLFHLQIYRVFTYKSTFNPSTPLFSDFLLLHWTYSSYQTETLYPSTNVSPYPGLPYTLLGAQSTYSLCFFCFSLRYCYIPPWPDPTGTGFQACCPTQAQDLGCSGTFKGPLVNISALSSFTRGEDHSRTVPRWKAMFTWASPSLENPCSFLSFPWAQPVSQYCAPSFAKLWNL